MRKTILKSILVALAFAQMPCFSYAVTTTMERKADKQQAEKWVNETFNSLSKRERVSQLMVPMIVPKRDNEENSLSYVVKTENVGGLIISRAKTDIFYDYIATARKMSKTPLLITIDGEWGTAMRLTDVEPFPRNLVLGAITDDRLIYEFGLEVARQCRELTVNVDYAPVLDVNTNPDNPIIGDRSFGEEPERVAQKGVAFSKGLEDGGVLSVAKHFPGHGSTFEDSHKTLPTIKKSVEEIELVDAVPFRRYINAGLGGTLVGHLDVPAFDDSGAPATFSSKIVDSFLKGKLGFEGLIFTDALGMKGAVGQGSPCVNALKAGNDVLLAPKNISKEIDAVLKAIEDGEISQESIDERCRKVLRYKYYLGLNKPDTVLAEGLRERIDSPKSKALISKLWAASMTVFRNQNNIMPINDLSDIVVCDITGRCSKFDNTCRLYGDVTVRTNTNAFKDKDVKTIILPFIKNDASSVKCLKDAAESKKNVIAVFLMNPYKVSAFAEALNNENVSAVMAYDKVEIAQSFAAQAIFGGIDVDAKLPVTILGIAKAGEGFSFKANKLSYTTPEEAGVSSKVLASVDSIARYGVSTGAFPGCQVLMAKGGKVFCNKSYGITDALVNAKVDEFTLYDLASVSKATGTLAGVMKAYDEGLFSIDDKVSKYIDGLKKSNKKDLMVKELLFHESGIKPSLAMYDILLDHESYEGDMFKDHRSEGYTLYIGSAYGNDSAKIRKDLFSDKYSNKYSVKICEGIYAVPAVYDTLMNRIYDQKLMKTKKYAYSCLNFCLLMQMEENLTKRKHNKYVLEEVFEPLGAYRCMYRPFDKFSKREVAPTEYDAMLRKQKMHGYVHDELCCFSGGVQGNAGLFANSNDLAKYCQMLLNGGTYGNKRILSEKTVDLFLTTKSPTCRRGLGFDKPNKEDEDKSPTCEGASAATFGHLGYTGTCFWVDPDEDMIFIFLCNRVNPTRDNRAFNDLNIRPKLFQFFYDNLLE